MTVQKMNDGQTVAESDDGGYDYGRQNEAQFL